ncbi:MAG: hypothetical protein L6Q76_12805 [Polyangiaceae bacterium]|nr:hypothetical protein [Polyangiaceae bacterium]
MNRTPEEDAAWLAAMIKLEEELGPIIPGGAQGGVIARARRVQPDGAAPVARPSMAVRARARVRSTYQAVEKSDKAA